MEVRIHWVEAAEVDEMWSYVGKKKAPRWLWHAIDHQNEQGLGVRVRPALRFCVPWS